MRNNDSKGLFTVIFDSALESPVDKMIDEQYHLRLLCFELIIIQLHRFIQEGPGIPEINPMRAFLSSQLIVRVGGVGL